MPTLRPYQERFIASIRAAYAAGSRRVLGVSPTGSGKTVCFSFMASQAVAKGLRVGIVAHRIEILDQIATALDQWGVPYGFVAPGRQINPLAPVQICSVQSLVRRIERYQARPFDFLIVDEAHHAAAGTSWAAVIGVHADKRILGVTATPTRLSGEPLTECFDNLVIGPTTAELIALGALSPYIAFAPATPELGMVKRRMGDYDRAELDAFMDKATITGDAVREYQRRTPGKRAVAFCVSVAHAEHVAASFMGAGIAALSVDGKMDRRVRSAAIASFKAGETMVLTSADLVSEGFDLPAIEAAILLRPTRSLALYLQQVGRALRPYPGKDRAVILDHASNIRAHGLPDDEREWSLEGREKGKRGPIGPTMPTNMCERCFYIGRPFTACPLCGHVREVQGRIVELVAGDLEAVDVEAVRRARKVEQASARTLDELIRLGTSRGYPNPHGWARHMIAARAKR